MATRIPRRLPALVVATGASAVLAGAIVACAPILGSHFDDATLATTDDAGGGGGADGAPVVVTVNDDTPSTIPGLALWLAADRGVDVVTTGA